MKEILISVIVPAYNIGPYIGRCLDSILNQSYQSLEIIAVDDGSTDETGKIIDQYAAKDSRIIPIHKENGGVSSARLTGISKATGLYIGFVDGDDYIEPEMYEHLLENALKYHADISHCGYRMIFPDYHYYDYYGTQILKEQDHNEALIDLLLGNQIEPSLGNKLFHRKTLSSFRDSSLWDSDIRINEDLLMNYLCFKEANKSVYEDKTYYHYILRKGSAATSRQERYKLIDPLKVITIIKDDVVGNEELYHIAYQRYLRALMNIAMQKEWKEDSNESKKALKKELHSPDFDERCTSKKLKGMVIGVSYFSIAYRMVRIIYERITGVSNKYKV